jgi:pimeloyl-ACP methyl ester carboxylesterase
LEADKNQGHLSTIFARIAVVSFRTLFTFALLASSSLMSTSQAATSLHADVLVFVPAYEGSQLFDDNLKGTNDPVCVWGNADVFLSTKRYFALRMPNPLEARTMRSVGPVDIYGRFISTLAKKSDAAPGFAPYTPGADFFVFDYDWRQDMATVTAPLLGRALERYAAIHAARTGIPARDTRFIIVTHSMGGLVARTLLGEQPQWAPRIAKMYLVGSPNAGSVKAIRTVVYGPDSLKAYATGFPGVLLNLVPTGVDQNVTKLTGITRPSLYELLPTGNPHWIRVISGRRETMPDAFATEPWKRYWPTAALEQKLFVDGWLKAREAEGRKKIDPSKWIFCRSDQPLETLLAQARHWRDTMGSLQHTSDLLTAPRQPTRLRLILSRGLKTASGVVTAGEHDASTGTYTYLEGDGDGTVEARRVLEGLPENASNVKVLHGVPHGKLMGNAPFLSYLVAELSGQKMTQTK